MQNRWYLLPFPSLLFAVATFGGCAGDEGGYPAEDAVTNLDFEEVGLGRLGDDWTTRIKATKMGA